MEVKLGGPKAVDVPGNNADAVLAANTSCTPTSRQHGDCYGDRELAKGRPWHRGPEQLGKAP